jgi:hypothetical protein
MTQMSMEAPLVPCEALDQDRYFGELVNRIDDTVPGDRIALMTMGLDPREAVTALVMDATVRAAERGVETHAATDAYAFMIDDKRSRPGPLFWHGKMPNTFSPVFGPRVFTLKRIGEHALGHSNIINQPSRAFTLPYAGRSHMKGAVVNNWTSFGGANLDHTERLNTMVTMEDPATADYVYETFTDIIAAGNTNVLGTEDKAFAVDAATDVLIDVGIPNQSLIMDRAIKAVDEADEWIILSSQFLPAGEMAEHVLEAIRMDKSVHVVYNHHSVMGMIEAKWQQYIQARARRKHPAAYFSGELPPNSCMNHSKLLATDKELFDGTNNYHPLGVKLGTAEISLHRREPAFARRAARNFLGMINRSNHPQFAHLHDRPEPPKATRLSSIM